MNQHNQEDPGGRFDVWVGLAVGCFVFWLLLQLRGALLRDFPPQQIDQSVRGQFEEYYDNQELGVGEPYDEPIINTWDPL